MFKYSIMIILIIGIFSSLYAKDKKSKSNGVVVLTITATHPRNANIEAEHQFIVDGKECRLRSKRVSGKVIEKKIRCIELKWAIDDIRQAAKDEKVYDGPVTLAPQMYTAHISQKYDGKGPKEGEFYTGDANGLDPMSNTLSSKFYGWSL